MLAWVGLVLFLGCLGELLRTAPAPGPTPEMAQEPVPSGRYRHGVVLDPGHGGADSGAVAGGLVEKELTLDLAQRVAAVLRRRGVPVRLTREDDRYVPLPTRVRLADAVPGAVFVSIHFNHAATAAGGIETFFTARKDPLAPGNPTSPNPAGGASRLWQWVSWFSGGAGREDNVGGGDSAEGTTAMAATAGPASTGDEGQALAARIQAAVVGGVVATDRGVKERGLYVTRHVRAPAVLVEGGFLSNPGEAKKLADPAYRQRLADAIAAGIVEYLESAPRTRPSADGGNACPSEERSRLV